MQLLWNIPQGCFLENWTPLPSELSFLLFYYLSPLSVGQDFNKLPIVLGSSNLVCNFYGTFPRGCFFGKLDPTPLRIEFFPFFISPPDFLHGFNKLLIIVGPSNLACVFHKIFLRGVFPKSGPHYPRN